MTRFNKAFLTGCVMGLLVLWLALKLELGANSVAIFVNPVAILIVIGGTVSCALISLPFQDLWRVFERTWYAVRNPRTDFIGTAVQVIRLSVETNKDQLHLEKAESTVANAMLRDSIQLINMGFKSEDLRRFLEVRRDQNESSLNQASIFYFSLSKLGPALGLVGTLIGLVILLYYHMGGGNIDKVASSMGVALTATLYGVALANLIFGPLAEYMQLTAEKSYLLDTLVIEGVVQIKERKHPVYLVQALKSYMPREDFSKFDEIVRQEIKRPTPVKDSASPPKPSEGREGAAA
jgi:chemotaxis protein MotA